jgi:hypothetical protein
VVWLPRIDTSFGFRGNGFGFNIVWTSGTTVSVESSIDFENAAWQPLQTVTLSSDSANFRDSNMAGDSSRFYRVAWLESPE